MTALPKPSGRVRMDRMMATHALVARASALSFDRLRLFAGDVISRDDATVRRAVEHALAEAEALPGTSPRQPRPEPPWAENWFCARCFTLMVGGRTPGGLCPGCEDTAWSCSRCHAKPVTARPADGICGACKVSAYADEIGLADAVDAA